MFCFIKTQLFFFCVLLPTIICSQNVFEEFEGIPVSIYPSIHNHNNFQIIEELGAFAVCEKDLDLTKLSTIGQTNLKVIPYNRDNLSPQAILRHIVEFKSKREAW